MQPLLAEAAPRIEQERALPPDVLAALHAAGMFRLTMPRELDGAEVAPATLMQITEALAEADASTAWCVGQAAGCAVSAAHLSAESARRLFGTPEAVLAWGAGASGLARPVAGGWRISGRWMFASGLRHSTLLGGHCPVAEGPDAPVITFLFPRTAAQVTDPWRVVGLRGTGSDSYAVDDLFVPEDATLDRAVPAPHPAPLYRLPLIQLYPGAFGGVALGIARAMLQSFMALATEKTPRGLRRPLAQNAAIQSLLGHSTARLRAARALLLTTLSEMYAEFEAGGALRSEHALGIRMASTFAIQEAVAVADLIYHEAGASAIFDANPFERRLRDIHAVAQQVQGRRANFELVGQHLLGITDGPLFV
ncbi:MAG: acyl-CoA dehydrogenase family protein [Alphaproteobacteria bacterium]|nr:acyl-CoA dehydrogenase family protein [Alphaproteobacteria bacterium]